ncbi:hypothetical protein SLEP1_g42215 [Rubroshorea leprosula]|uniref:Uncharacterized protein n=1 Tax=Rubroshorea leprosula TaxID=152421 RepID=A0AAV5L9C3_9ROSI|nr:hypothetical protein SLEP1_g42215 [Rubroshorea leprosula]
MIVKDKVKQENRLFTWKTAYKENRIEIISSLVAMRNWVFYVEIELYRLVLGLEFKTPWKLTSALKSLKESK